MRKKLLKIAEKVTDQLEGDLDLEELDVLEKKIEFLRHLRTLLYGNNISPGLDS